MLDLDSIRQMARCHGFDEIQMNGVSRVIAFGKEGPGPRCRINIYYTTGTVATCLDHPRSGKTQLFRRDQTNGDIDAIFRNPRQHTGVGYYRSKDRENWQPVVDGHGIRHGNFHRVECDDARRWRYIQSTQEGFCNDAQANQIAALCKLWHQLRFAPPNGNDIMTEAEKFNAMSPEEFEEFNRVLLQMGHSGVSICEDCEETGCRCTERAGAWCSMVRVILKVARDTDGVEGVYNNGEEEKFDIKSVEQVVDCECNDGLLFRQRYSSFLHKLERQFRSFPQRIRRELLHWFISKHMHNYEPFLWDPSFDPDMDITRENCPFLAYGALFCSNEIRQAHHDYGEMAYTEGGKGCNCHGI
ncbi:hypothetical protein ACHAXR_003141 [Thalassiosira sp. AJA248-18]